MTTYPIIPAAGYHFLTPVFDLLSASAGVGSRFRAHVIANAGITDGARVLDVGCGSGQLVVAIAQRHPGSSVVGVDADTRILDRARRRARAKETRNVEFVHARAEHTDLPPASFDAAVSTLVFHHLPVEAKAAAAGEVARLLRPGAVFLLVDIRPLRPRRRALAPAERNDPRLGYRTNMPAALGAVLEEAGFSVTAVSAPPAWALRPWLFALRCIKRPNAA